MNLWITIHKFIHFYGLEKNLHKNLIAKKINLFGNFPYLLKRDTLINGNGKRMCKDM